MALCHWAEEREYIGLDWLRKNHLKSICREFEKGRQLGCKEGVRKKG